MKISKYINIKSIFAFVAVIGLFVNNLFAQATTVAATAVVDPEKNAYIPKMVTYYLLLFLLVCIVIALIGKILSVYDLTKKVQGAKQGFSWDKFNGILFLLFLVVGLYGTYWSYTIQGAQILPESASEHGVKIDEMFNVTLIITTIVFVITHILLFVFTYKYSYSSKKKAYFLPHNNTLEKYWTVIPAIVLTILVLMGFFTWRDITNISQDGIKNAIHIEVTAHQFAWEARYGGKDNVNGRKNYKLIGGLGGLNSLGVDLADKNNYDDLTVSEIVLPVNKPVRFTLGSKDVLHSFYMPHFRVQMNCVPGMATYFQFTPRLTTADMRDKVNDPNFNYFLLCAKICGGSHFNMKFAVRVVSQKEYDKWLLVQKPLVNTAMIKAYQENLANNETNSATNKIALNN
ncbi:MAG: cytochrome c oxidase subunit II [Sphingobacteriales bacterium]|nr:MAG: cytochrome c oxidase subunit II [Sphingobacteriales bacterium]TAF81408.1 MAG: cytochrome c oxidase subunit II [Sphingobacteriales bacterium]